MGLMVGEGLAMHLYEGEAGIEAKQPPTTRINMC